MTKYSKDTVDRKIIGPQTYRTATGSDSTNFGKFGETDGC